MSLSSPQLTKIRHSLAHILMQALSRLYAAIPGVGPAVEDGFYHDFECERQITENDLSEIEREMKKIIQENLPIKKQMMLAEQALKVLKQKNYFYTAELAAELKKEGEKEISFYAQGEFSNMCRGPHLAATGEIKSGSFGLTKIATAFWKNDSSKKLQRIYGVAFETESALRDYFQLTQGKEFKKNKAAVDNNEYLILTPSGKEYAPEDYQYQKNETEFRIMTEKEALKKELKDEKKESEFLAYAKRLGFEWEKMSAPGHMRFGPKAALISNLIADYSEKLVKNLGLSVYTVKGTNLFNLQEKAVKEHAELFGDRLYKMEIEKQNFVMRYAACHQQFAMIKDWQISYKNLPFGAFEVADSYRFEQSGELLLLFRCRQFDMPDLHIFTRNLEESKGWCFKIHQKIFEEMDKLGRNYEMLINFTSKEFYQENKKWILELLKYRNKPALLNFYPPGKNYYWLLNIEYNIIDNLLRTREIGTFQIDTGNAERFGIKYIGEDGSAKYPQIIHTAVLGSVGRYLYAVLDTALRKQPVELPLWLCPTQIRFIPVSDKFLKSAAKIAASFEKQSIRCDIDDRAKTVGHKIRDAELDLVPYTIVIGEKEKSGRVFLVRVRKTGQQKKFSAAALVKEIVKQTQDWPFRPLNTGKFLSRNPIF